MEGRLRFEEAAYEVTRMCPQWTQGSKTELNSPVRYYPHADSHERGQWQTGGNDARTSSSVSHEEEKGPRRGWDAVSFGTPIITYKQTY